MVEKRLFLCVGKSLHNWWWRHDTCDVDKKYEESIAFKAFYFGWGIYLVTATKIGGPVTRITRARLPSWWDWQLPVLRSPRHFKIRKLRLYAWHAFHAEGWPKLRHSWKEVESYLLLPHRPRARVCDVIGWSTCLWPALLIVFMQSAPSRLELAIQMFT